MWPTNGILSAKKTAKKSSFSDQTSLFEKENKLLGEKCKPHTNMENLLCNGNDTET